jgi:glycosyltransferase involved in cell wall biosynthesis
VNVVLIGEGGVSDKVRLLLPYVSLGYTDTIYVAGADDPNLSWPKADVVVICRARIPRVIEMYKRLGSKVIFDTDDDFDSIPVQHPGYRTVGRGNPEGLYSHHTCLALADKVTVSTNELCRRLERYNPHVLPNSWRKTPAFEYREKHHGFVLGFSGTITHRGDWQICSKAVQGFLSNEPSSRIVIIGDIEIYKTLSSVPELRKKFIPMLPPEVYTRALGYFDVVLAPLVDDEFNRAKSAVKLIDAGGKGIPWLASDILPYQEWGEGGYLLKDSEWLNALFQIRNNYDDYERLSFNSTSKAQLFEISRIKHLWKEVLDNL